MGCLIRQGERVGRVPEEEKEIFRNENLSVKIQTEKVELGARGEKEIKEMKETINTILNDDRIMSNDQKFSIINILF